MPLFLPPFNIMVNLTESVYNIISNNMDVSGISIQKDEKKFRHSIVWQDCLSAIVICIQLTLTYCLTICLCVWPGMHFSCVLFSFFLRKILLCCWLPRAGGTTGGNYLFWVLLKRILHLEEMVWKIKREWELCFIKIIRTFIFCLL